jgi:uncharacterized membrane protein YeiH
MLQTFILVLDWFGICVFAVSGALVASRKEMDIVGFALLGSVTGIGGGTIRDVLLGTDPVFWVRQPAYLVTCVAAAAITFFVAHIPQSRERLLLWFDAAGLSLFSVTGADSALSAGASPTIAVAMGVATATFGGIIRDILGGESPIILKQEIYITAALLGSTVFVSLEGLGFSRDAAAGTAFAAALALRSAALYWNLSLPRYRSRTGPGDRS